MKSEIYISLKFTRIEINKVTRNFTPELENSSGPTQHIIDG